ncbi:allantoinase AllB [Intrasporangium sp.]|uniref:allantoinase AllB n=1 Tax=Intrasporangium sp. TaxID=1925024 RepID=UPI00293AF866|nr:allantoinase AllB [Intrasporangium sp.]MDV3221551.1 allantoinase AllB [Intrasporangium sp.]
MVAPLDLVIRADRVVTPTGEAARSIGVASGRIVAVEPLGAALEGSVVVDLADDEVLLPGLVDTHVHVNDPGRTEWEGFASATRAAAAGGVTTIVDMPLNSVPPTVDLAALDVKRRTAEDQVWVDVGFWGGAVPGNLSELRPLHEEGVFGFKCFLLPSGVDEFPPLDLAELVHVMREIASLDGLLIVHAEDAETIERAAVGVVQGRRYGDFLASRPREAENVAVAHVIDLARHTGCRVHVLHVSSAEALPLIAAAKDDGVRLTAETCPHYLYFAGEEVPDGATQFKCCPPIREADNLEQLWDGLADGALDIVVSDHSPSTPQLKALDTGDFGRAWGGISSLQLGLSVVWTGARQRGFSLADVTRWMAEKPADLVGLSHKGRIAVGADADFCVFAPEDGLVVDAAQLHHRNPITPYDGRRLLGVVRQTWLRGEPLDIDAPPRGRLLRRGES